MLELIKRKSGLNMIYWQMNYTLEELQEKHPDKLVYIEKLDKAMREIAETVEYLTHCENVFRATERRSHKLELENLQLKQENRSLNNHLKTLISGEI